MHENLDFPYDMPLKVVSSKLIKYRLEKGVTNKNEKYCSLIRNNFNNGKHENTL